MQNNKLEQLVIVRDEMLTDPDVQGLLIWNAAKLALEDDYLYNLMIEWMKEPNVDYRKDILQDVIAYADEALRQMNIRQ